MPSSISAAPLLQPLNTGALEFPNRILMAPMTRLRTLPDLSVQPIAETYYAQRASAGLIISEVVAVAPYGAGYGLMPAFITDAQTASWKKIVAAVHAAGGRIAAQLWHSGRARRAEDFAGDTGPFPAVRRPLLPAELTAAELAAMPKDFATAARAAIDIGFDAVEVHSGNAMLLANFLRGDANQRTDEFGGSADNRPRLLLNILEAVTSAVGKGRVGVKVAPNSAFRGRFDPTARETFARLLPRLAALDLAYVQVNRPSTGDLADCTGETTSIEWVREHYSGTLVGAENFGLEDGAQAVADGTLDAIAYGRPFLANPDLPARFAQGAPLNELRLDTVYGTGESGYLDYPALQYAEA